MEIPYMKPTQYAQHIMHMRKLIKNATRNKPLLENEILVGLTALEHHNNALEAQVDTIEQFHIAKLRLSDRRANQWQRN